MRCDIAQADKADGAREQLVAINNKSLEIPTGSDRLKVSTGSLMSSRRNKFPDVRFYQVPSGSGRFHSLSLAIVGN